MENENLFSRIKALKNKQLTKVLMISTAIFMVGWFMVNVVWSIQPVDYQAKWDNNNLQYQVDKCKIERDWCNNKLDNRENYSEDELKNCVAKSKWTCDFQ